jgi:hypothetical protein
MPVKLPAPADGTAEHAAPNGAAIADALDDGDADMDVEGDAALAVVPLEPHAVAPSAMAAETVAIAASLYFTGTPSDGNGLIFWVERFPGWSVSG